MSHIAQTPLRVSKKVSSKYTINKVILDVELLLSGGLKAV
jgi:hypothetical protein